MPNLLIDGAEVDGKRVGASAGVLRFRVDGASVLKAQFDGAKNPAAKR